MTVTVAEGLRRVTDGLTRRGVTNAEREAQELVARAAAFSRDMLPARLRDPLSPEVAPVLDAWVLRRAAGTPLAYLIGEWDFRDFTLTVTPDVLVPRPETEGLFERAARAGDAFGASARWVDCGTGSGALALAIARRWPEARVTAVDLSAAALAVARWNARRLGLEGRVAFRQNDLLSGWTPGSVDGLVANLPYVEEAAWPDLSPEVRQEPRLALWGGVDGLDVFRRFAPQAARVLRPGGRVFLEVGQGQASAVADLLAAAGFAEVRRDVDFAGIERYVEGTR